MPAPSLRCSSRGPRLSVLRRASDLWASRRGWWRLGQRRGPTTSSGGFNVIRIRMSMQTGMKCKTCSRITKQNGNSTTSYKMRELILNPVHSPFLLVPAPVGRFGGPMTITRHYNPTTNVTGSWIAMPTNNPSKKDFWGGVRSRNPCIPIFPSL